MQDGEYFMQSIGLPIMSLVVAPKGARCLPELSLTHWIEDKLMPDLELLLPLQWRAKSIAFYCWAEDEKTPDLLALPVQLEKPICC